MSTEPVTQPTQPSHPILLKLKFIVDNVESAQQLKAKFNLQDCEEFLNVVKTLTDFFTSEEEEKLSDQKEVDAIVKLTDLCESQNSTGIFSINGSVMILHALREINEALNAVKNPSLKFKELKAEIKHGKSKK